MRHARTVAAPGLCYGRLDVPADPADTRTCAQHLATVLAPGLIVRTSPARRCQELARALQGQRPDLRASVDVRLQELDFGCWEGRTWEAIGEAALSAWTAAFADHRPGGGEALQSLLDRVGLALEDVRDTGRDTVWITHAGVIRAARLLAHGVRRIERAADWPDAPVPFGAIETLAL
ncbi:MAG TPA: histidine phosphatase family protein [Ramlibacter sp.]|uniref:histidine phosphatase family protein n=1 Tax=Ramlibacter sp. TaxID=1917967 RepID=UPI002D431DF3|nr:histidine phosphatase family protein [Ramlibacter sp.]HZY19711.1 histidine phosphatase family protein [Ramlibacter sp.]